MGYAQDTNRVYHAHINMKHQHLKCSGGSTMDETVTQSEIRTITNNRPEPVTVISGESHDLMFSIPAKGVWNGSLIVPWVARQSEMDKCITLSIDGQKFAHVFQDYNSANAQICWSVQGTYQPNYEVQGSNRDGGRKALAITNKPAQDGLWMETYRKP